MSRIDRRAFVMGCLAVPLAGCTDTAPHQEFAPSALAPAKFLNNGHWATGNTSVFVVTGGINPKP